MKLETIERLSGILDEERSELLRHRAVLRGEEARLNTAVADADRRRDQAAGQLSLHEHEQFGVFCASLGVVRARLLGQIRRLQEADLAVGARLLDLHRRDRAYQLLRQRAETELRRARERRERGAYDGLAVRNWLRGRQQGDGR